MRARFYLMIDRFARVWLHSDKLKAVPSRLWKDLRETAALLSSKYHFTDSALHNAAYALREC